MLNTSVCGVLVMMVAMWTFANLFAAITWLKYQISINQIQTHTMKAIQDLSTDWGNYKMCLLPLWSNKNLKRKRQNLKTIDVTLVTQCSVNKLHHLIELFNYWEGPVSVAIYAPRYHFVHAYLAAHVCAKCFSRRDVAYQLVYPKLQPPQFSEEALEVWYNVFAAANHTIWCRKILTLLRSLSEPKYVFNGIVYPHNTLRNIARSRVSTSHILLLDVDVIPSPGTRESYLNHLATFKDNQNVAYVIPAFEMKEDVIMPNNKRELVEAMAKQKVRIFHSQTCQMCHRATNYKDWISIPENWDHFIAYETAYEESWEPFYISRLATPSHDERFIGYGYDRISQICELHVSGFSFVVLSNSFVVHRGWKEAGKFHRNKNKENRHNWQIFNMVSLQRINQIIKGYFEANYMQKISG